MQLFIMPTTNTGYHNARQPKYASTLGNYSQVYGSATDALCLVGTDITGLQVLTLQLNLDVFTYDINLDNSFGLLNALLLFQTAHENRFIPVDWLVLGMTFRVIARRVMTILRVGDYMKTHGEEFRSIGFDDPIGDYSSGALSTWHTAMNVQGIDTSGVGTIITLRQAMAGTLPQIDSVPLALSSVGTV